LGAEAPAVAFGVGVGVQGKDLQSLFISTPASKVGNNYNGITAESRRAGGRAPAKAGARVLGRRNSKVPRVIRPAYTSVCVRACFHVDTAQEKEE